MADRSVLVVDDSEDYRSLLVRTFKPAGFRVRDARTAEEAWVALESGIPDVAILDWNLPGASGIDLARRIRADARFARIVLIMLSVNSRPQEQVQGLREGQVNAYMTKPFSAPELLARVEALLKRRDSR
jgi:two-component system phosphate regulon response regulator PhoB